jgi:hypothetical protein
LQSQSPDISLPAAFDPTTGHQLKDGLKPGEPCGNIGAFGCIAKCYQPFMDWAEQYCKDNGSNLYAATTQHFSYSRKVIILQRPMTCKQAATIAREQLSKPPFPRIVA